MAGPGGALEHTLSIVSKLLGRGVAPEENFFSAGGHSLMALQLVAQLRASGLEISLPSVIAAKSLADIAAAAVPARQEQNAAAPAYSYATTRQERTLGLLEDLGLAPFGDSYVIAGAYRVMAPVANEDLRRCLRELVAQHPPLHTYLTRDDYGILIRADVEDAEPVLEFRSDARLDGAATDEIVADVGARIITAILREGVPLGARPGLKAVVVAGAAAKCLVLAVHHSVVDGEGLAALARELERRIASGGSGGDWPAAVANAYARLQESDEADGDPKTLAFWTRVFDGVTTPVYKSYSGRGTRGRVRSTTRGVAAAAVAPVVQGGKATIHAAWSAVLAFAANHRLLDTTRNKLVLPTFSSLRQETDGVRALGYSLDIIPLVVACGEADSILDGAISVRTQIEAWMAGAASSLADLSTNVSEVNRLFLDTRFPLVAYQVVHRDRPFEGMLKPVEFGARADDFAPTMPLDALVSIVICGGDAEIWIACPDGGFDPGWSEAFCDAVGAVSAALARDAALWSVPSADVAVRLGWR